MKTDLLPGGELIASENEQELNQKAECVKDELITTWLARSVQMYAHTNLRRAEFGLL